MSCSRHNEPLPLVAVLGPTCSGKSNVALRLAQALGGEIISCDSMQVYRGLDIGTAKPSAADRAAIPHHFIDLLDLHERCSASRFALHAETALAGMALRGHPAVLVGGTGLYAKTLIYGLEMLPADRHVASKLGRELQEPGGPQALGAELTAAYPDAPPALLANHRRLLRALEVLRLTGRYPAPQTPRRPAQRWLQVVLLPPLDTHRELIRRRTAAMFDAGWIEETRQLVRHGLLETPTARQALGYRDIAEGLEANADPEELKERVAARTLQYARRQRTWFRHQHRGALLMPLQHGVNSEQIASAVLRHVNKLSTDYWQKTQ